MNIKHVSDPLYRAVSNYLDKELHYEDSQSVPEVEVLHSKDVIKWRKTSYNEYLQPLVAS